MTSASRHVVTTSEVTTMWHYRNSIIIIIIINKNTSHLDLTLQIWAELKVVGELPVPPAFYLTISVVSCAIEIPARQQQQPCSVSLENFARNLKKKTLPLKLYWNDRNCGDINCEDSFASNVRCFAVLFSHCGTAPPAHSLAQRSVVEIQSSFTAVAERTQERPQRSKHLGPFVRRQRSAITPASLLTPSILYTRHKCWT